MYKIYINENVLILSEPTDKSVQNTDMHYVLKVNYRGQPKSLFPYIDSLEKAKDHQIIIINTDDLKKLWKDFKSIFILVKASGGATRNRKGELLAIFRKGFWDLPKGKKEYGETKKETGLREVMEETGVVNLVIDQKLIKTYHSYRIKGQRALKITQWYIMSSNDKQLRPQKKEGIVKVKWMSLSEWAGLEDQTYLNIIDVIAAYKQRILMELDFKL